MSIDEQIVVLQAKKAGKKIEARSLTDNIDEWGLWTGDCNFEKFEYRIVREPREWNIVDTGGKTPTLIALPVEHRLHETWRIIARAVEDLSAAPAGTIPA